MLLRPYDASPHQSRSFGRLTLQVPSADGTPRRPLYDRVPPLPPPPSPFLHLPLHGSTGSDDLHSQPQRSSTTYNKPPPPRIIPPRGHEGPGYASPTISTSSKLFSPTSSPNASPVGTRPPPSRGLSSGSGGGASLLPQDHLAALIPSPTNSRDASPLPSWRARSASPAGRSGRRTSLKLRDVDRVSLKASDRWAHHSNGQSPNGASPALTRAQYGRYKVYANNLADGDEGRSESARMRNARNANDDSWKEYGHSLSAEARERQVQIKIRQQQEDVELRSKYHEARREKVSTHAAHIIPTIPLCSQTPLLYLLFEGTSEGAAVHTQDGLGEAWLTIGQGSDGSSGGAQDQVRDKPRGQAASCCGGEGTARES